MSDTNGVHRHGDGVPAGPANKTRVHTIGSQPNKCVGAHAGVSIFMTLAVMTGVVRSLVSMDSTNRPPCLRIAPKSAITGPHVSMEIACGSHHPHLPQVIELHTTL